MERQQVDVLVVGAGVAGASAAVEASRSGARVLGIDAASAFGGTAGIGGGGICVPASRQQAERGIIDTPDFALEDLAAIGNHFHIEWATRYFRSARTEVCEWFEGFGVSFEAVVHIEGDRVPRWHRPAGGGAAVMAAVWAGMAKLETPPQWRFGLRLSELLIDGDGLSGVVVTDEHGTRSAIRVGRVILATGGFAGNADRLASLGGRLGEAPRLLAAGNPNARGDVLSILEPHGIRVDYLDDVYAYATGMPDHDDPTDRRAVILRGSELVWLNRAGLRFYPEDRGISGNSATRKLLEQPEATAWAIFDAIGRHSILVHDHYPLARGETNDQTVARHLARSRFAWRSDDLGDVLRRCGIDHVEGLRTIDRWNGLVRSGISVDPVTGRDMRSAMPIIDAPFHAVQLFPAARKCLGGIQTDHECRVRRIDGSVVPGLYAAGEAAGLAGGHLAGSRPLEGMMVGGSCLSGRIAGAFAASRRPRLR